MAKEWEKEVGRLAETVTLRCLAGSLPASTWQKLLYQAIQGKGWNELNQCYLAATFLSCIYHNRSTASLILQYLSVSLQSLSPAHQDIGPICKPVQICIALLDDIPIMQMAKDSLQELCTTIVSHNTTYDTIFNIKRCTASIHLLQMGRLTQIDSIVQLASTLLTSFAPHLEHSKDTNEEERATCLVAIQMAIKEEVGFTATLLARMQSTLETGLKAGDVSMMSLDRSKITQEGSEQANSKISFLKVVQDFSKGSVIWPSESIDDTLIEVQPEVVNLLHLLVDDYCHWQVKVDATRMLLSARLDCKGRTKIDDIYVRFYLELFLGAASACAAIAGTPATMGGDEEYSGVWRSALCGMIPSIVENLEAERSRDSQEKGNSTKACMAKVVKTLLSEPSQAMTGCEVVLSSKEEKKRKEGNDSAFDEDVDAAMLDVFIGGDDGPARQPVRAAFMRSLEDKNLLIRDDWRHLEGVETVLDDWQLLGDSFMSELGSDGGKADGTLSSNTLHLASLIESKLNNETMEEVGVWTRLVDDYSCQQAFAHAVLKVFSQDYISANELENLSRLCKSLMANSNALNVILLYICPSQVLEPIASLLDDQDLFQNGEEPSVVGSILLFAQLIIQKGLGANCTLKNLLPSEEKNQSLVTFIRSSASVQSNSRLSSKNKGIVSNWVTALFGSEGISDELIKSTSPQSLLRMMPILFSQSITACCHDVIDLDTLRGGLTYFLQDLLSYTLPSALTWLLCDLSRCQEEEQSSIFKDPATKAVWAKAKMIKLDVLCTLLLSDSCPGIVQSLVANRAARVLGICDTGEYSKDLKKLQSIVESLSKAKQMQKTHLWIKIGQKAMTSNSCNLDPLFNLDLSISAIVRKRGTKAALQIILDNLHLYPKSDSLSRAIAVSLSLATLQGNPKSDLKTEIVVEFANQIKSTTKHAVKSAIETLELTLQLLLSYSPTDEALPSRSLISVTDSIQAMIALQIQRQLKKAKNHKEVGFIARLYGILFHNLSRRSVLAQSFA